VFAAQRYQNNPDSRELKMSTEMIDADSNQRYKYDQHMAWTQVIPESSGVGVGVGIGW
jgi:hypothetical protein